MNDTIEVVPYNPAWPALFASEAKLIRHALGSNCIAIHHIGSTSVPNLSAKPIIDMMPVVKDILAVDRAIPAMESLNYEAKGEYGIAFRRYFQKGKQVRTHNVHVYEEGDPEISRYLKFRDWMISHPADAKAYAELKQHLAASSQNILQYCNGKDAFVASIDEKDGYDGWRMVQALTDREWAAVDKLRHLYFLKSNTTPSPLLSPHPDHIHFVFYKNAEIIGYAYLKLGRRHRAEINMIVIDEPYLNCGFENQLLQLCKRWLTHQGMTA